MNPEKTGSGDYNFPPRRQTLREEAVEVRERHLDVLRGRLIKKALDYAYRQYQERLSTATDIAERAALADDAYRAYTERADLIKSAVIIFDDRIENIGANEYSYSRFIKDFVAPEEEQDTIEYIRKELELL